MRASLGRVSRIVNCDVRAGAYLCTPANAEFLDFTLLPGKFRAMPDRTVRLVLQYDGTRFAGWQRQPDARTVQGELERVVERLFNAPTTVTGAGRTDAGVHARGQAAHVTVGDRWETPRLRRALNSLVPPDIWVADAADAPPGFHARFTATARRYTYYVGTDDASASPFRRPYEWAVRDPLDRAALDASAGALLGEHRFYGFAVRGTAPPGDEHRCTITVASWRERSGGLEFVIEANRFLHHMVRFLVGTMVDVASGRRSLASFTALLDADDNRAVSPPAPAHGLFLDHVTYPFQPHLERP